MSIQHRFLPTLRALGLGLLAAGQVWAHEGPEHEIEELTDLIAKGETADLLLQRAIEYRVIGKNSEAATDLERASQLDSSSLLLQRELGRAYFAIGKTNEAVDLLSHALKARTEQPTELASLRALRAEFLGARNENKKALEDCEAAIRLQLSNVEWYLLRSDFHRRLKLTKERIAGLEQGIRVTGAGILETERVEALLEDAQYATALPLIEQELKASRIQGSWLIRRARARLGLGEKDAAKADLETALREINRRVNSTAANPTLLTERALAHELLGAREEARGYYEQARDAGADDWVKDKIKTLKAEEEARAKELEKEKEKEKSRQAAGSDSK